MKSLCNIMGRCHAARLRCKYCPINLLSSNALYAVPLLVSKNLGLRRIGDFVFETEIKSLMSIIKYFIYVFV